MIAEVLRSYELSLNFLRRLVQDVPEEQMTSQPAGAVNHPAWVIGHLVQSAQAIGGEIGISPWPPESWEQWFGTGSNPASERAAYPSKQLMLDILSDAQHRLKQRLTSIGEDALAAPLPDVRYRDIYPTVDHAVLHILTAHAAIHIGQLTVWRRVMGLGPISEPFV